mmetsp:Transcript_10590/g.22874  ORF Transcript_10590/g.22874 Transcript_10590/m.22874 type:complete len:118 (+) Transcript_10590:157-510(+)
MTPTGFEQLIIPTAQALPPSGTMSAFHSLLLLWIPMSKATFASEQGTSIAPTPLCQKVPTSFPNTFLTPHSFPSQQFPPRSSRETPSPPPPPPHSTPRPQLHPHLRLSPPVSSPTGP